MPQRSIWSKANRPPTRKRFSRSLSLAIAFVATLFIAALLFAAPVYAQSPEMGAGVALAESPLGSQFAGGAHSWVQITIASVLAVLGAWMLAAWGLWLARRFRWVTPHRYSRLARGTQVVMGGLLLSAVFIPYLAEHHPVVAVGLPTGATLMAIFFGFRAPQIIDQNPGY
jgi:hypothetical protein